MKIVARAMGITLLLLSPGIGFSDDAITHTTPLQPPGKRGYVLQVSQENCPPLKPNQLIDVLAESGPQGHRNIEVVLRKAKLVSIKLKGKEAYRLMLDLNSMDSEKLARKLAGPGVVIYVEESQE